MGTTKSLSIALLLINGSPPRVWGQRPIYPVGPQIGNGSPPRVWGQRPTHAIIIKTLRGSPPRVWGQLTTCPEVRASDAVHPHGCGDNILIAKKSARASRFTPTGVGTTTGRPVFEFPDGGSPPRVWGQRFKAAVITLKFSGSPPRVWGQPSWLIILAILRDGSPPRVWGQRISCIPPGRLMTVHPHGCGDNVQNTTSGVPINTGSPPRVWGQRRFVRLINVCLYFTPTGVGTTLPFCPILLGFYQENPLYVYQMSGGVSQTPGGKALFRVRRINQ